MNYEVLHVANGYLIRPAHDMRYDGGQYRWELVYVFNNWDKAAAKLQELLNEKGIAK